MMHPPYSPHDTLTESQRSERMSKVRSTDTGPEMVVRRLTHALGYDLPPMFGPHAVS